MNGSSISWGARTAPKEFPSSPVFREGIRPRIYVAHRGAPPACTASDRRDQGPWAWEFWRRLWVHGAHDALSRVVHSFEGSPDHLALIWIDVLHPWRENWLLPEETRNALAEQGARLLRLGCDSDNQDAADRFHDEHHPNDERWSHAKVYRLQRGNSRRLLVTSANFSQAAWGKRDGDGGLAIENFELGVCVEQAVWPFDELEPFERWETLS